MRPNVLATTLVCLPRDEVKVAVLSEEIVPRTLSNVKSPVLANDTPDKSVLRETLRTLSIVQAFAADVLVRVQSQLAALSFMP